MTIPACPTCTSYSAKHKSRKILSTSESLFPIGTLRLSKLPTSVFVSCPRCMPSTSPEGRHCITGNRVLQTLCGDKAPHTKDIDFLTQHDFVTAEIELITGSDTDLFVRISIVPHDLPGCGGQLMNRNRKTVSDAQQHYQNLLPCLLDQHGSSPSPVFLSKVDNRTLSGIYSDLPSPPLPSLPTDKIISRLLDLHDDLVGFGLRTKLYNYQRETVASMIANERTTRPRVDPLYLRLIALDGREFYFQPKTMVALLEQPQVTASSGGILCEELGTGKTVMILSVVLATRQTLSSPEPSIVKPRPVYTPVSLSAFPAYTAERRRLLRRTTPYDEHLPFPSLRDILFHRGLTAPETTFPNPILTSMRSAQYLNLSHCWETLQATPHLVDRLRTNQPFYYHTKDNTTDCERTQRGSDKDKPRKIYLTTGTLIIVPVTLLRQWEREVHKHVQCDDLRLLVVHSKDKLPKAKELASAYDVVLMTVPRFSREKNVTAERNSCKCGFLPDTRIPDCECSSAGLSPLMQIRWKRLVVDEGHVSAATNTNLTPLAQSLSVEHRWIVTGTPTTNLLGLGFGSNCNMPSNDQVEEPEVISSTDPIDDATRESDDTQLQRVWTDHDRQDLTKLGNMISKFLGVKQFVAPSKSFTEMVAALMGDNGPLPGAITVLQQVMESVMVRHRVEDVEKDIVLPPITQESVFLDLEPLAVKSYNALQASIAINAIDSQRTDEDYLFHSSKITFLRELMENMSQILFWAVDERYYNTPEMLANAEITIETAKGRNVSVEDMTLLHDALDCVREAASDHLWGSIQDHGDHLAYQVTQISIPLFDSWTRVPFTNNDGLRFLHGDRLMEIRETVTKRPLISDEQMLERAKAISHRDLLQEEFAAEILKRQDRKERKTSQLHKSAKKTASAEMINDMKKELNATLKRLEALETQDDDSAPDTPINTLRSEIIGGLISSSPHRNISVGKSCSSKLNYIINEVLQYASSEKFLIFSRSVLTLAWIGEALELLGIKFLSFTTVHSISLREQTVLTFETSDTFRVFLMELKHGARGLNLVSASRVIFCEPVWEADVESQAVKRVHRIGQTRPVTVKTLAIRKTAEENMIHRRKALQSASTNKQPRLLDDAGFRSYIENPKFIRDTPQELPEVNFQLFNVSQLDTSTESDVDPEYCVAPPQKRKLKRVHVETSSQEDLPPSKKASIVRFID